MKHGFSYRRSGAIGALSKALFLGMALAWAHPARAIDREWIGGAGNQLWSSAANWNPAGAPQNGDRLRFISDPVGPDLGENDLVDLRLASIVAAWFYTIRGNGFVISNGISGGINCRLKIECPITLGRNQEFRSGDLSAIEITGGVDLNGFDLTVSGEGRSPSDEHLNIPSAIGGSGNILKVGDGVVSLGATNVINTFDGAVTITEGTLKVVGQEPLGVSRKPVVVRSGELQLFGTVSATPLVFTNFIGKLTGGGFSSWGGPIQLFTSAIFEAVTRSNHFQISGQITGDAANLDFVGGCFEITGRGNNFFSGFTRVECELLMLNKIAGARAFSGPIVLGSPGTNEVRWLGNNQVAGAPIILANRFAVANLNGFFDHTSQLRWSIAGTLETGVGELTVSGPVTFDGVEPSVVRGNLRLTSGLHEFSVRDDPQATEELIIQAGIHGPGSIFKSGPGTLGLHGGNDYTGLTLISDGIVAISHGGALGSTDSPTTVNEGGTLWLNFLGGLVNEQLILRGAGFGGTNGALRASGNIEVRNLFPGIFSAVELTTNATLQVDSAQLMITGELGGDGPLTKTGPGVLVFAGNQANTYTGDTIISRGVLELRKPNNVLSVPGNLTLGPGPAVPLVVARLYQTGGLRVNATITANANSLLDLNGNSQSLARLNLNDGGSAQTGAGRLNFLPSAVVQVGSLSLFGSRASSFIAGNIGLPANAFISFNVRPYAPVFPFPSGPELDVPAFISIDGFENPDFIPAGFSKANLGRMRLGGNGAQKGSVRINGGTLQLDGSQPQSPIELNAGARLQGSGIVGHIAVNGNSTIAPGGSPGILTCSNFNAFPGSGVLQVELNGTTPGSGHDQLNVRGTVNLNGITLGGSLGFASAVGNQFTVINNDGADAITGTFTGLPQNANFHIGSEKFTITYTGGSGNDVVLRRLVTPPVPTLKIEPAPLALVRLLWPTSAVGFTLQFNTNLNETANWTAASPPPVVIGANHVVTNATTGQQRFYRLLSP